MRDEQKTKEQLMDELVELRRRVAELEAADTERKRAEEALQVSHRFLETTNRHTEMTPLLKEFVAEVKNFTGCAAVGLRVLDEEGNIPYEAYKGFSRRFYESESPLSIKSDQCMCINVIKGDTDPNLSFYTEGGSFYMNGTTRFLATVSEEEKGPTRNVCNEFGYESVALVPIRVENRILGLIHVADPKENMIPLEMVKVLEGATMQLGAAIQRVLAEEELAHMATHDPLTDVPNRRGFFTLARQQLKMADRAKKRMALLFADFDHLKQINDAFGHSEGDRALIEVADVLKETFRESDIIARIGGDEFVALAIETDEASAEILTTRLQENLQARNARGERRYKLSLSVGVARYDPEHPCSIDELLARADRLMYEQKEDSQKS